MEFIPFLGISFGAAAELRKAGPAAEDCPEPAAQVPDYAVATPAEPPQLPERAEEPVQ
jgi:hypothetical protein